MKIAMPVNNMSMESSVASSFGRTPYFLVYDIETDTANFLDNGAAASQGGAGIKAAQTVADSKADAVLAPQCGENAANVLKTAKMKIYRTLDGTAQENIDAFKAGNLSLLSEIHAGFHNHGGK